MPLSNEILGAIFDVLKKHHNEYDPYDGDSIVFFKDQRLMHMTKCIVAELWSATWDLYRDEPDEVVFSDLKDENCVLTMKREAFDDASYNGFLKIIV